ncbi:MAG TPA: toprim domain-containing protein, partial [Candidatus Polarisedimenticolia bacterium]|nr:toprim domain-containing protein [Candidatus Polarisedimenticolia bacterium]
ALEFLARRANIELDDAPAAARKHAKKPLFDVVNWAATQYQTCYTDSADAAEARRYLGERKLLGPTLRRFGVGYAPLAGDWLVKQATAAGVSLDHLEKAGLIARRTHDSGFYDRFRDRVLFPIRDSLGRPVGFGGRILPNSPLASRGPKYYNSPDTPLFNKSEQLFGLDLARTPASKEGFLAVVEGYTDVLMAHQCGIGNVVATMGTALTATHVYNLRRFAGSADAGMPRVVLVFDADDGGNTGVDRALGIFASQEVDLAIAMLPAGLDPCDLLTQDGGAQKFRDILASAVDALDFKLARVLAEGGAVGVEGQRRAVDAVLAIIALAPEMSGQAGAVKRELIVTRIARRLVLKEETVWARLEELRAEERRRSAERDSRPAVQLRSDEREAESEEEYRAARAAPEERQLLEILLAEPALVGRAIKGVTPDEVRHPGLRKMLEGLSALHAEGLEPSIDQLRVRILNPRLAEYILKLCDVGRQNPDRPGYLDKLLKFFRDRRAERDKQEISNQLHAARDHTAALELLRQLQNQEGL